MIHSRPAMAADNDELWAPPTTEIWRGHDRTEAEGCAQALFDAAIPNRIFEDNSAGEFSLCVYPATAKIAREVLLAPRQQFPFAESIEACDKPVGECPICGRDYFMFGRVCFDCLAELVPPGTEEAEVALAGSVEHPGDAVLILNRMRQAGIPCYLSGRERDAAHILLPRGPLQPKRYGFHVLAANLAQAQDVIRSVPLCAVPPAEAALESRPDDARFFEQEDFSLNTEVWHGADAETGEALRYAFREHEIPSELRQPNADGWTLFVSSEHADRAREIVKQVTEGVPFEEIVATQDEQPEPVSEMDGSFGSILSSILANPADRDAAEWRPRRHTPKPNSGRDKSEEEK